jgi:hypothetical protein
MLLFRITYSTHHVFHLVIWIREEDDVLPRSKCHPSCFTLPSGCAKKTLFCRVPNVILSVLPRHLDAQRRRCFAVFHMSSYVLYLVIRMPRSKCHPSCFTLPSGCAKKTLFCRISHVILRVLPRHPDAQRRCYFAKFQMSSYVSYLVIRMHKEYIVLPHSKRHPTCLFSSSGCTLHKEDVVLPHSECHPTCLTLSSGCAKKTLFSAFQCHPTCLTSSSGCTKKTMLCRGAFRLISSDGIVTLNDR